MFINYVVIIELVLNKILSNAAKVVKPSVGANNTKGTPAKNVQSSRSFADVGQFVEEILNKTSKLLLSEVNKNEYFLSILNLCCTSCMRLKNLDYTDQGRNYWAAWRAA